MIKMEPWAQYKDAVILTKEAYAELCLAASKWNELKDCDDCISRAEAIKYMYGIVDVIKYYHPHSTAKNVLFSEVIAKLKDVPSVTPQPKEPQRVGQWIRANDPNERYNCSNCGGACWYYDYWGTVAKSNYCPNCGAKMEVQE